MTCEHCRSCGRPLPEQTGPGKRRIYCGDACKQAAYRARLDIEAAPKRTADDLRDQAHRLEVMAHRNVHLDQDARAQILAAKDLLLSAAARVQPARLFS